MDTMTQAKHCTRDVAPLKRVMAKRYRHTVPELFSRQIQPLFLYHPREYTAGMSHWQILMRILMNVRFVNLFIFSNYYAKDIDGQSTLKVP